MPVIGIALIILAVILFLSDLVLGSVNIPFYEVWGILTGEEAGKRSWEIIVLDSRLPRALSAILSGAALSVCGLLMQTLFRNPLAGPYILGISSGAGLGVALLVMGAGIFGFSFSALSGVMSSWMFSLAAITGAGFVLLIIFLASTKVKDIMTILILGIMLGSIMTAIVSILQYFSNDAELKKFIIWSMGSLSGVKKNELLVLLPLVLIGVIMSFFQSKKLNAFLLGENYASSIGVNTRVTRIFIIVVTGVLAGSVTAFCGPIGFVGIVIPHICRMVFRTSDHRILIPFSVIIGINVLLISDIISQLPGSDYVLPVNSVTALIGIPIILWIVFSRRSISSSF